MLNACTVWQESDTRMLAGVGLFGWAIEMPSSAYMQFCGGAPKLDWWPRVLMICDDTFGSVTGCQAMMGKPFGPISGGKRWVFAVAGGAGVEPGMRPGGKGPGGRREAPAVTHGWICGGSWKPPSAGVAACAGGE